MRTAMGALCAWTPRRLAVAGGAAAAAAVVTGIPTDLIDTPLVGRPVAITVWSYSLWAVTSVLIGLLVAASLGSREPSRTVAGGGILTIFAMGCPLCNKPILLLLGTAGALEVWAPLQPAVGALAVALLGAALLLRLRRSAACRVAPSAAGAPPG
ncbi:MAG: hypothetical protein OXG37_01795 [Actinomycetia bacterium]|nr:hypothetical protein [Actinomycetes bacterium]